jgi:signal peptidase I
VSVDFAAILVALSALTGLIWLFDHLFFAKARRARLGEQAKEPLAVEYARSFFPVIFIVLIIRSFLAEPFRIPSSSMMPTLLIGDFILVNKFAYGIRLPVLHTKIVEVGAPARGDVAVFRYPVNPSEDYIKRVIGLPGDEIVYRGKRLFVNGQEVLAEPLGRYVGTGRGRDQTGAEIKAQALDAAAFSILQNPVAFGAGEGQWTVPDGHYFVLGDNRDNSLDSRFWGFVPEQHLVGRAFLIWMNWDGGIDVGRLGTVIH